MSVLTTGKQLHQGSSISNKGVSSYRFVPDPFARIVGLRMIIAMTLRMPLESPTAFTVYLIRTRESDPGGSYSHLN